MKQTKSPKTARQTTSDTWRDPSGSQSGIEITPPAYGMDFVDRGYSVTVTPPSPMYFPSDLEEEEPLQRKFATTVSPMQFQTASIPGENLTGMPDRLKAGLEQLSGLDVSGARVRYNSAKPASLNAVAYTQGQDVEVGPGQERHLPHEGWHLVQQMQGRVKPTMQANGVLINDDTALEREADVMGAKALKMTRGDRGAARSAPQTSPPLQRRIRAESAPQQVSAPTSGVLQLKGVGGKKIGFKRYDAENNEDAWTKLSHCWLLAKVRRSILKDRIESTLPKKKGQRGFSEYYAEELDEIKDERELLLDTLEAVSFGPTVKIYPNNFITVVIQRESAASKEILIGEVISEPHELYVKSGSESETVREIFKKQDPLAKRAGEKEYIKDRRGVYTRRHAYHEMNYHQMMDFVMSGELTGRYQMFMSAGEADNTSPQKIGHEENKKAVTKRNLKSTSPDLTWEEVAVLHQWKGSGPYQAGVSLTSTSRKEVRSNKGELFASKGGFRLKIDLAKVEAEIPIVNDYSFGGVGQGAKETTKLRPKNYDFAKSATKNRELYIERVKKEWVVEVVHHGEKEVATTLSEIEETMRDDVGAKEEVTGIGMRAYLRGFEEGMKGNDFNAGGKEGRLGAGAGTNALAGYARGVKQRAEKGDVVATPEEALKEQALYEQGKVPKEHTFDAHKVGYMRGRCTTKPMFASADEYGSAISGHGKV